MEEQMLLDLLLDDGLEMNEIGVVVTMLADSVPDHSKCTEETNKKNTYFENIIPNYSLSEFKDHFGMSRGIFEDLLIQLGAIFDEKERHVVPVIKKCLFTTWVLSKQESFLAAEERFDITKGTGRYLFLEVISAIMTMQESVIKWPTSQECVKISNRIENSSNIPGVVGIIDVTRIKMKQQQQQHSIILQAVCDDKKIFTDIFIGMLDETHHSQIFKDSPLYHKLCGHPPLLPPHQHIIGDTVYPLNEFLLKPYQNNNGRLTATETRFNNALNDERKVIGIAFALLKGRWRRLMCLDMSQPEKISEVVTVCCILHNFILQSDPDDDLLNNEELSQIRDDEDEDEQKLRESGDFKRNNIALLLN